MQYNSIASTEVRLDVYKTAGIFDIADSEDFDKLLSTNSVIKTLSSGYSWPEGPVWIPSDGGYLVFTDIDTYKMYKLVLPSTVTEFLKIPAGEGFKNGNFLDQNERIVSCQAGTKNRQQVSVITNGVGYPLVTNSVGGLNFFELNDLTIKSDGSIWFTDSSFKTSASPGTPGYPNGYFVYRYMEKDNNGTAVPVVMDNLQAPNGICLSPDETKLYVADTKLSIIKVYNVSKDNVITSGSKFCDVVYPDGIKCDSNGNIWACSLYVGIEIFAPDGHLIGRIRRSNTTTCNVCFGGPDGKTLFIVGQPNVCSIPVGVSGVFAKKTVVPPTITQQPSSQKVGMGSTVTFDVVAEGNSLSYQWYFNDALITGETNSSLVLRDVTGNAAGRYYVEVRNAEGGSVKTGEALLEIKVIEPPTITQQPASQKVYIGNDVTFSVVAEGNSLTYQWYFNNTPIEGGTNSTLILRGVTSEAAGMYNAEIRNGEGGFASTSYARLEISFAQELGAEREAFPDFAPEDLGARIERLSDLSLKVTPVSSVLPLYYRRAQDPVGEYVMFYIQRTTSVLGVERAKGYAAERTLFLDPTNATASVQLWQPVYAKHSKLNGFVRIPYETPRKELKTLVVLLHPYLANVHATNNAFTWETDHGMGPVCDKYRFVSYFPNTSSGSVWNGKDGPQASDYAVIMSGIRMCRSLVPTIEKVKVVGYGPGVETAMGLAQIWPGVFDSLLLICGGNFRTTSIESYAKYVNGGKPVVYNPPVPVVILNSYQENVNGYGSAVKMKAAVEWFAAANGFTGTPVINPIKRDYMSSKEGEDSTITEYGEYVRYIVTDIPNVMGSWAPGLLNNGGFDILFRRFLKEGKLPGDE